MAFGREAIKWDLIADPRKWNQGFRQAERTSSRFGTGLFSLAKRIAGPAAVGAIGIAALDVASKFRNASNTIRVGTGATGKALEGLNKDFRRVYGQVPSSAEDAATAIADLNTRTGQTGKGLQQLSKQELNLSRITKTDLGENIAASTRMFRDWSIPTRNQAKALDEIFRASQTTGVGVTDLMQKVVQFGSPLRQLGFNFEQTTALFGEFERAGVVTETVLPGLKMGLKNFALAHKDPQKALIETTKRIKEAKTAAEANDLAFKTFGARAGPDLAAAIREGHFDLQGLIDTIAHGGDTIAKASNDTLTWRDKLEILRHKLEAFAAPTLLKGFDFISGKLDGLQSFLRDHLVPKLGELKKAWDDNKGSILALADPLESASGKFSNADDNAKHLADTLKGTVEAAGKIARAAKTTGIALDIAAAESQLWGLRTRSAGITAAIGIVTASGTIAQALDNTAIGFLTFVKHTLGLFDPAIRRSAQNGIEAFRRWRDETRANVDSTVGSLRAAREKTGHEIAVMGAQIASYTAALRGERPRVNAAARAIAAAATNPLKLHNVAATLGREAGLGLASGLDSGTSKQSVSKHAAALAQWVVFKTNRELGIRSPSVIMRHSGELFVEGLVLGIASKVPRLEAAAAAAGTSGAVALGKALAVQRGWTGSQWTALYQLWAHESGWRWNATNPSSGAYGIPQALPAGKMGSVASDWRTNARTQELWGMNYIASVYGNPANAWAAWLSRSPHWYASGLEPTLFTRPTLIGVGDRPGGEVVSVTPGRRSGAGMTVNVVVHVAGSVVGGTPKQIAKALEPHTTQALKDSLRSRGKSKLADQL